MSNKVAPVPHTISHAELDMLPEDAISQRIENYIPLRFPDVRERLIEVISAVLHASNGL